MIKPILFILLVFVSEHATRVAYGHLGDDDVTDTWGTNTQSGDVIYPVTAHYKAVLFHTQEALTLYLKQKDVNGNILIEVGKNKQFVVRQKTIMDTVRVTLPKLREYESTMEEFKP